MRHTNHTPTSAQQAFDREVGAWLRRERKRAKVSQERLGAHIGVHRNTIKRYEDGTTMPLWAYTHIIQKLGYRLQVTPAGKEAA